jgi:hypothetical protein
MPLTRLLNGSISSAKPCGENTWQWCLLMIGFSLGSILIRCARASSRIFAVVLTFDGTLDGDISFKGLAATTRRVSGVTNVAFVPSGIASRLTRSGALPWMSPEESDADINPTATGVGVAGGRTRLEGLLRLGVAGPSLLLVIGLPVSSAALFLFLLVFAAFGGADPFTVFSLTMEDAALKRVDLLVDIAKLNGGPR